MGHGAQVGEHRCRSTLRPIRARLRPYKAAFRGFRARIGSVAIDASMARRYSAELIGTALLGVLRRWHGDSHFRLPCLRQQRRGRNPADWPHLRADPLPALVAVIGPISGCHVNPAVTLGAFLARRMTVSIWSATGWRSSSAVCWAHCCCCGSYSSPFYVRPRIGLGANGYGSLSLLHASAGGAFLIEVIITAVFVLMVLSATRKEASAPVAGLIIGFALALVDVIGIPIDGASVNPARSSGRRSLSAARGSASWLFIIAPLVGGVIAAGLFMLFHQVGVQRPWRRRRGRTRHDNVAADEAASLRTGPAAATTAPCHLEQAAWCRVPRHDRRCQRAAGGEATAGRAGLAARPRRTGGPGEGTGRLTRRQDSAEEQPEAAGTAPWAARRSADPAGGRCSRLAHGCGATQAAWSDEKIAR